VKRIKFAIEIQKLAFGWYPKPCKRNRAEGKTAKDAAVFYDEGSVRKGKAIEGEYRRECQSFLKRTARFAEDDRIRKCPARKRTDELPLEGPSTPVGS
jgi:hypothetical protein